MKKEPGHHETEATGSSKNLEAKVINDQSKMDPEHLKKIAALMPHILNSAHVLLRSHGVNAVVNRISFQPTDHVADLNESCESFSCCWVNGSLQCPCPE